MTPGCPRTGVTRSVAPPRNLPDQQPCRLWFGAFRDRRPRRHVHPALGTSPASTTPFDYSYEDQRGVEDPAIQLPGAHWVQQPKIRGEITNRISITTIGRGTCTASSGSRAKRERTAGFWQKDLYTLNRGSSGWKFVATPKAPITGRWLDNPPGTARSAVGAGRPRPALLRERSQLPGRDPGFPTFPAGGPCFGSASTTEKHRPESLPDDMVRIYPRARASTANHGSSWEPSRSRHGPGRPG